MPKPKSAASCTAESASSLTPTGSGRTGPRIGRTAAFKAQHAARPAMSSRTSELLFLDERAGHQQPDPGVERRVGRRQPQRRAPGDGGGQLVAVVEQLQVGDE